jgi:hypothetical protein
MEDLQRYRRKKIERHNEEIKHLTALFIMLTKVQRACQQVKEENLSDSNTMWHVIGKTLSLNNVEDLQRYIMKKIVRHNEEIKNLNALFTILTKVKETGQELDESAFSDSDTSDTDNSEAESLKECDIQLVDND